MSHPLKHFRAITDESVSSPLVLSVGIPPACVNSLGAELLSVSGSGRDALAALKLMRFNWLLATMELADMRPWVLFERARRAQARLQCALVDDRVTLEEERRVRAAGAAIFSPCDESLYAAIVRSTPRTGRLASREFGAGEAAPAPP
jgi:hypothetical protein